MEVRHLRYFVAVAEEQHFRRAADRLQVAQPGLSRWIAALEKELDVQLFERVGRGVRLSHSGQAFLTDALRLLDEVDRAALRVRRVAKGKAGTLSLAFAEIGAGNGLIPDAVRAFRSAEPEVEVSLVGLNAVQQIEALHRRQVDGGFLYRTTAADPDLSSRMLGIEGMYLAVPRGHRLARRSSVRFSDLGEDPLLCISRSANPLFYDTLMQSLFASGLSTRVTQDAANSWIVLSLVAVGMGLGIVSAAARWRLPRDIVLIPLWARELRYRFEFVSRQDNDSPALAKFLSILSAAQSPPRTKPRPP